jgi:hypothetical protein
LRAKSDLEDAKRKAEEKKKKFDTGQVSYNEDGTRYKYLKPYMGVNEFLEGLTNSDDKLFFPEFIEHNYWRTRFLDWSEGKYNDDEKELFGFTDDTAPKLDLHPDLMKFDPDPSWDEKTLRKKFDDVTTKE